MANMKNDQASKLIVGIVIIVGVVGLLSLFMDDS